MSIVPFHGSRRAQSEVTTVPPDPGTIVEEDVLVHEVSIFAEDGPNGKTSFSIFLRFDQGSNLSNRQRRSVQITGLTLGVEDKEIPILARLAGRSLSIFVEKSTSSIQLEDLAREVQELRVENYKLQEKNRALSENLHTLVEESFKAS